MTETAMKRGQEIKDDISGLQQALSHISRSHFFNIDTNGSCIRQAEPFLAQLEVDLRNMASQRVLDQIEKLEREFDLL